VGMSLKVAIQMDPIEKISIAGDTTFALMLEAAARGNELHYYRPENLSLRDGRAIAHAAPIVVRDILGDHFSLGPAQTIDLATMDVVLLRQDPPFDLAYITSTHILERLAPGTLVVNDPASTARW
jgi:glutathione synthase